MIVFVDSKTVKRDGLIIVGEYHSQSEDKDFFINGGREDPRF